MFRRSRPGDAPPDPFAELGSRWHYPMRRIGDVVARLRRLEENVGHTRPDGAAPDGPSEDQLRALTAQADRAWDAAWQVALEATRREGSLSAVDPSRVAADLEEARRRLAAVPEGSVDSVSAAAEVNTRESQFRAVHDVWNMVDDADAHLRTIASELEDAAARVGIGRPSATDVDAAIDGMVAVNAELVTLHDSMGASTTP